MAGAEAAERAVLDASVAVRWLVPEEGSAEAAALLARPIVWHAPRLMPNEVAAALRRKVAGGEIGTGLALQALDVLLDAVADGLIRLAEDERLARPALLLALDLGHKLPDCLYLALAESEGAGLATADRRLEGLARGRGVEVLGVPAA